jgi:protein-tyrosine phosphatase
MSNHDSAHVRPPVWLELEGTHNTRDLGGYATRARSFTRFNTTFRSDTLENATTGDAAKLKSIGIELLIDLRTFEESTESLWRYRLAHDEQIKYVCLPAIPEGVMATRVFPVGDPIAIGDLYFENLLQCGESWGAALTLLMSSGPTILHCAAGRDRTGAMSAILLSNAEVSDEEVALDYTATASRVRLLHDQLARNPFYRESQVHDPSEMTAEPMAIYRFLDRIRGEFGSVGNLANTLTGDMGASERLKRRLA